MRNKLAIMKNVVRLRTAYESLAQRDHGVPGMGLVHGFTGAGKTTAIAWLVNQSQGIYVRAASTWTPASMLGDIMAELGLAPIHRNSAAMKVVAERISDQARPLFVDESDYLFSNGKMLDSLRDIHDVSGSPVILVGMEGIEARLASRKQLARRISQWVEFLPADIADARVLAQAVCEIDLKDDLLAELHEQTNGSVGLMVVGMSRIEALAKANSWSGVDLDLWGNRQFFLSQPPKGAKVIPMPSKRV